ncbi:hypothetical protein LTR37_021407 [Vermiconidia calcicola]|uniref:Uncharacterized protein n=1 Tax=Vermiconidia calcicola TaxID=1690605 RepID=A0ACC3MBN6_9PEZI|nr:hypothetical protein LTR37_021407 [Vermiconidia calcicola]
MANMFGALNRFIARLDSDPQVQQQKGPSNNTYGFQVVRNSDPNLQLEPWFDFVIGINGRSTISLGVYGVKGQQIREIYAAVPLDSANIGLSLQWTPLGVAEDVWHILDVMPNSPADVAGLLPYGDYVIGSPERQLHGEGALGELVEDFLDQPLRLFVYNHEYDVTRMLTITPAKNWGGDGAMGCVLGYGALHRVPAPLTEPTQDPGETLFESSNDFSQAPQDTYTSADQPPLDAQGGGFLVPANMQTLPSTSPPPPRSGPSPSGKPKKQRTHHTAVPAAGLDDYFAEGEQKSRELDKGSSPKPSGNLPPPPPKGGPPKASSPAPSAE